MSKLTNDEIYKNTKQCRELEDSFPEFEIDKTQFIIMSSEEIKRKSVCEITSNSPTDVGGINDPRLGPQTESVICETCHKTLSYCSGHYGYISLKSPLINPEMKQAVLMLLSCVCNDCSRLLVPKALIKSDKSLMNKKGMERLTAMKDLAVRCNTCPRSSEPPCNPTPEYKINDNKDLHVVKYCFKYKKGKQVCTSYNFRTIEEVYTIFDNIEEEDLTFLGFDGIHPRDLIMQNLIVPPPSCRPPLIQDGEIKQDFITTSYSQIISTNEKLKKRGLSENDRKDCEKKLSTLIYHLISSTTDSTQGKSCGSKSLRKRLNGKEGLPRKGANGKRGDYSGRTVIGGDASIPFGWISVPREFANVLTRKVVVTGYNVERMKRLFSSNKVTHNTPSSGRYAGCCMMISPLVRDQLSPKIGDTLDVLMEDGDIVTFNRQPTLHRSCMMSFRVLLHDANTIRIHSSITEATNADYDGDDANIYMHIGTETIVENYLLSNVTCNIPNFHQSGVMTSLYYHARLGAYYLTEPSVIIDEEDWELGMEIFDRSVNANTKRSSRFKTFETRLKLSGIHPRSGKALVSALFPPDFCMDYGGIKIRNGILISGQLTGKSFGGFGLVHQITKIYDVHVARRLISEAQWLFDWYLSIRGCSLSLKDIVPKNRNEVSEYVEETLTKTQLLVNQFYKEDISEDLRESKILSALSMAEDGGKKVATKFLDEDNPYVAIYSSGAKGSANNFKCMMAMYGQEVNCGMRPKFTISNNTRFCCLNDFNDNDVTARGFITRSFVQGLDPVSFVMHIDSARDGINSSNLATPESGFMGRKLNTTLRNDLISSTGEVVTVNKQIIQFSYGDGMDPSKLTIAQTVRQGRRKSFIDLQSLVKRLICQTIS